ncbi:polysaccharide biosynthesis/export family protein [Leptolyngbya sp. CCNP1308]|uniref:polysaccharide biosynthesis/export family protein n=1 Tax=Leptolyngbya sp. CCNP1308 TaxID=3110255 RepID=UPI002B1FB2A7|nr:polysaccharide biosynthesis/export family protein [Leptolyngbya sp. CCNP1308]MEA5450706.1 polysaccharide biosynthesis/export family protein [Leptolyngbya sp. CCNP1308]
MVFCGSTRGWGARALGCWGSLAGLWLAIAIAPALAQTPPADFPRSSPDPSLRLDSEIPNAPTPNTVFDDYRLGPGDGIFVGVQRFPDLSFPATLDIQGNVVMPLAGTLNLTGLTLEETRETIFNLYNEYVVNPDVSVILTTQRPVEVTVVGEVPRPGLYPLQAPQLSVALLTAGGSTTLADLRLVQVDRPLENGEIMSRTIDLFTPLLQGEPIPQVRLQDGDVITVPRLTPEAVESYDRALVATSTLARPEITIRVLNRAAGARGGEARFGSINLRNGSRFLDALAVAGVNPDVAAYNRIAVLRFNPETGSADTITVDATAAVNGDLTQNIPLQENDILVVDRNLLARVSYALNTFTQPFRDVLGFLLFFDSLTDSADSLFRP